MAKQIEDFRNSNVDRVQVIKVVEVVSYFGEGTPDSIGRQIVEYYTLDGTRLAIVDKFAAPKGKQDSNG